MNSIASNGLDSAKSCSMNTMFHRYFFIFSIGVFFVFIVSVKNLHPLYQSNDDLGMSLIASGVGYLNEPSEAIYHSNIILGHVLKYLYTHAPHFPWYAYMLILFQLISALAIFYSVLKTRWTTVRFVLLICFLVTFNIYFITNLQFTSTAFLAAMAGFSLLVALVQANQKDRWPAYQTVATCMAALLLFAVSMLLRLNAFYLTIILTIPVLAMLAWKHGWRHKGLISAGCTMFAAVVVSGLLHGVNLSYYRSDPQWAHFYELNQLAPSFTATADRTVNYTLQNKHVFDEHGLGVNDFATLFLWYFADPQVLTVEKLRSVAQAMEPDIGWRWNKAKHVLSELFSDRSILALALFALLATLFVQGKWNRAVIGVAAVATLFTLAGLALFMRLPAWVAVPMLSLPACLALLLSDLSGPGKNPHAAALTLVLPIALTLFVFAQHHVQADRHRSWMAGYANVVRELAHHQDALHIVFGSTLRIERISPFADLAALFSGLNLVSSTPFGLSPIGLRMASLHGVDNLTRAAFSSDNVYLVADAFQLIFFTAFIQEHYGKRVLLRLHTDSPLLTIVSLSPVDDHAPDDIASIAIPPERFYLITDGHGLPMFPHDLPLPRYTLATTKADHDKLREILHRAGLLP